MTRLFRHILDEASKKAKKLAVETDDLRKQARIFRQKLQVMMESQLEVVKGSEWDEILKQGDTSSFEEIQEAIRKDESLDKDGSSEVQSVADDISFSNGDSQTDTENDNETVVVFPDASDDTDDNEFADNVYINN